MDLLMVMLAVVFALTSSSLRAQTFYGNIAGTITDSSGAIVPNATVTATNSGTNEKHSVKTNASGDYRIVSLIPASYKVEVTAPNFKRFIQDIVTVQVDTTSTLNAMLAVGETSETVEVTTEAPLLQTESGSVGSTVEGKVVQEMPLNGRNVMSLLALVPGVVPGSSTSGPAPINGGIHLFTNGFGNFAIGGGIANESTQYIDGAPNTGLGGNITPLIMTQDMVQEFKVESNAVSAEYGHFGGGVVNMTSKSGTNGFHGSAYEYVRNTILNANDFISDNNNATLRAQGLAPNPKAPWHHNTYGAIIGGPIKRDKAFFEFSYENQTIHTSSGKSQYVPTLAERGLDPAYPGGYAIRNPMRDPGNGPLLAACPGAKLGTYNNGPYASFIPSSCVDATAAFMMGYYAYPNVAATGTNSNYFSTIASGADSYQYNVRIDENLSTKQRLFGRWTKWYIHTIGEDDFKGHPGHNPSVPSDYGSNYNTANNIVVGDTYTFNATTIGDLRVSYMREHFNNYGSAQGSFDVAKLGGEWTSIAPQMSYKETPIFGPLIGAPEAGPWNIPVGANQIDIQESYGLTASLTKIIGNHTFKFGMESQLRNHSGIGNYAWDAGQAIFNGLPVGPGYGDAWGAFVLGALGGGQLHTVKNSFTIDWSHGAYLADTWRYNSKLTFNYGVHWDYPGGIYEKRDRATVFLPNATDPTDGSIGGGSHPYLTVQIPGTIALTSSSLYPSRDVSPVKWNLISPRFSFAYSMKSDMVVRGGYGLSYLPPDMPIGLMAFNSPVNAVDTPFSCNGPGSWSKPFACAPYNGQILQPVGRTDPNPAHIYYGSYVQAPIPTTKYPYMQQWNLTLGKQWKGNIETDITYAGSKGTQLPEAGLSTGTGGSFMSVDQLNPAYYYMGVSALSAKAPCARLGGANISVGQCLQPFPQFNGVFNTGANGGSQSYNALYLTLAKRFQNGGVLNVNYTRSHTIGDTDQPGFASGGSWQNFYNPRSERAVASLDVPNRLIINYVLNLPFGKGQRWMNGASGISNVLVGGWQVNGITTEQSGSPISFTNSVANTTLFQSGNGTNNPWGAGVARPDLLPGCNLKTSGSWFTKVKTKTMFNASCVVPAGFQSYAEYQQYLANPAAFTSVMDQRQLMFGNAPRNSDAIRSQFFNNFDFALTKTTGIWESTSLVIKAEVFNLFNHPVFANPNAALGASSNQYDTVLGSQNPTSNQQRLMQLSARINF